ncbi:phosphatidylcholine/phosphatidylserine synthase [Aquimarina sp. RZ0]|uniref:CDP-alcohol phosphatidyltransferase family protein n=1 Tax=Aquimarina sp. RZ0 TaxID=2607730 RepID=UPI0011F21633|nr:CDP-alcohol phosphatidyltransferase family protein [Aquimarina sp. RZ0]KAA1243166.1 phosphatidylserine synthase [Aquimarina sp. RZ0]
MWLKKQIPNMITLLNLLCGCIAVILAVQNNLVLAAMFVMLGIGFDFFDGFAARILLVQSELGLQLDSLADMVTSGLVPGVVMFQLLARTQKTVSRTVFDSWGFDQNLTSIEMPYIAFTGLLITLASAYRLAKFNIDTRQTTSFIGLPTPANTLLIVSLPLILSFQSTEWIANLLDNPWFLIVLTLLSSYLLNAEIPLFSLKFKSWGFAENKVRYFFIILMLLLLVFLQFIAIPCIIIVYVLMSLLFRERSPK